MNDRRSRHPQWSRWLSLAGALLLSTGLSGARGEPQGNRTERYSALAVSVESPNESGSIPITIIIDRFTTDAEMKSYAETFRTELTLDKEGRGQGTAFLAFKPKFTKNDTLEIESLGNQPLRLLNVRRER
ncbi:MAG: hypothetical protein P8Y94_16240 [Acidobacteriota bacterium]